MRSHEKVPNARAVRDALRVCRLPDGADNGGGGAGGGGVDDVVASDEPDGFVHELLNEVDRRDAALLDAVNSRADADAPLTAAAAERKLASDDLRAARDDPSSGDGDGA